MLAPDKQMRNLWRAEEAQYPIRRLILYFDFGKLLKFIFHEFFLFTLVFCWFCCEKKSFKVDLGEFSLIMALTSAFCCEKKAEPLACHLPDNASDLLLIADCSGRSSAFPGNYDRCISNGFAWCTVWVPIKGAGGGAVPTGACMPAGCSASDVIDGSSPMGLILRLLNPLVYSLQAPDAQLRVHCGDGKPSDGWSPAAIALLAALLAQLLLVSMATAADYRRAAQQAQSDESLSSGSAVTSRSRWSEIFRRMSARHAFEALFAQPTARLPNASAATDAQPRAALCNAATPEAPAGLAPPSRHAPGSTAVDVKDPRIAQGDWRARLAPLHGVRVLSLLLVILGHTVLSALVPGFTYPEFIAERWSSLPFQTVISSEFAVDSFLVLSGLLGALALFPIKRLQVASRVAPASGWAQDRDGRHGGSLATTSPGTSESQIDGGELHSLSRPNRTRRNPRLSLEASTETMHLPVAQEDSGQQKPADSESNSKLESELTHHDLEVSNGSNRAFKLLVDDHSPRSPSRCPSPAGADTVAVRLDAPLDPAVATAVTLERVVESEPLDGDRGSLNMPLLAQRFLVISDSTRLIASETSADQLEGDGAGSLHHDDVSGHRPRGGVTNRFQAAFDGWRCDCRVLPRRRAGRLLIVAVAHRIVRLLPTLAAVVAFTGWILPHVASGPFWHTVSYGTAACRKWGWTNLLFVNNIVPWTNGFARQCAAWTWYLAVDTQLHLILLPLLAGFYRINKRLGWVAVALALIGSLTAGAVAVFENDLVGLLGSYRFPIRNDAVNIATVTATTTGSYPSLTHVDAHRQVSSSSQYISGDSLRRDSNAPGDYEDDFYRNAWTRAPAFLCGVAAGITMLEYISVTGRANGTASAPAPTRTRTRERGRSRLGCMAAAKLALRRHALSFTGTGCVAVLLLLFYLPARAYARADAGKPWSALSVHCWTAFSRALWSAALAGLLLSMVGGGCAPLTWMLGARVWRPLARLSFGAYMASSNCPQAASLKKCESLRLVRVSGRPSGTLSGPHSLTRSHVSVSEPFLYASLSAGTPSGDHCTLLKSGHTLPLLATRDSSFICQ